MKQADVVLLGYPLNLDMPAIVRSNDLQYYEVNVNPLCIVFLLHCFNIDVNIRMSASVKYVMSVVMMILGIKIYIFASNILLQS